MYSPTNGSVPVWATGMRMSADGRSAVFIHVSEIVGASRAASSPKLRASSSQSMLPGAGVLAAGSSAAMAVSEEIVGCVAVLPLQ